MEWPDHANGSALNLEYLLGKLATDTEHLSKDYQEIKAWLQHLEQENVQRQIEHAVLRTEVHLHTPEMPDAHGLSWTRMSELMEAGSVALDWAKAIFKALMTLRDLAIGLLSGTAVWKIWSDPLAVKHVLQGLAQAIGLS